MDQYHVKTDARSGLVSDPNREGDEATIVRLALRVTTVSLQTQKLLRFRDTRAIVNDDLLPRLFLRSNAVNCSSLRTRALTGLVLTASR